MRTKTTLLTAALGLAAAAATQAQVYSVNAVGYVNLSIPAGFSIIANPLNAADNTVAKLFVAPPDQTTIYTFDNASSQYTVDIFEFGAWDTTTTVLAPGQGFFINNQSSAAFVNTFVGEVPQGTASAPLTTAVPAGFSILSSQVPQSGALDTVLGFPDVEGTIVYFFNNATSQYDVYTYEFGQWDTPPGPPVPAVGQGFFVSAPSASTWSRVFSVNQ